MDKEFEDKMLNDEEEELEEKDEEQADEPKLYAGKYKTTEDLEKAYIEAQQLITEKASRAAELERQNQALSQQPAPEKAEEEPEFESAMEKRLYYENKDLVARMNVIQFEQTVNAVDNAFEGIELKYKEELDDAQKQAIFAEAQHQTGTTKQRIEKAYKVLTFDSRPSRQPQAPQRRSAPDIESPGAAAPVDSIDIIDRRGQAMLSALGIDSKDKDFRNSFKKALSGE